MGKYDRQLIPTAVLPDSRRYGSPHHGASRAGPPNVCLARSEHSHGATVLTELTSLGPGSRSSRVGLYPNCAKSLAARRRARVTTAAHREANACGYALSPIRSKLRRDRGVWRRLVRRNRQDFSGLDIRGCRIRQIDSSCRHGESNPRAD